MVKYEDTTPEQRKRSLDKANESERLQVYCMGDTEKEWVVAMDEEAAVHYYATESGFTNEEIYEVGVRKCGKEERLLWEINAVPTEDVHLFEKSEIPGFLLVPFTYSLYYMEAEAPYIIGTTERE